MTLIGDLNTEETDKVLFDFLSNLIKFPTCYKSFENLSYIDVIIANKHQTFQNTTSFSTGLLAFHKLVITSMKTTFPKVVPKTIIYRNMKISIEMLSFRQVLGLKLGQITSKSHRTSVKYVF